jgi:hypothetical protein
MTEEPIVDYFSGEVIIPVRSLLFHVHDGGRILRRQIALGKGGWDDVDQILDPLLICLVGKRRSFHLSPSEESVDHLDDRKG